MDGIQLQQRIDALASEGRGLLEKLADSHVSTRDLIFLRAKGHRDIFFALIVDGLQQHAQGYGVNLGVDVRYSEIREGLRGVFRDEKVPYIAGGYFIALYTLQDQEGKGQMKDGLVLDLVAGDQYAMTLMQIIDSYENGHRSVSNMSPSGRRIWLN